MARTADPNSNRQLAFQLLSRKYMMKTTPAKRLAKVMSVLGVDEPYAQSLIAAHKRLSMKDGTFVSVYRVKDRKNGKPCKPYMSRRGVYTVAVKKSDFITAADAKAAYINEQAKKINLVERL